MKRTPLARGTPLSRGDATLRRTVALAPGKPKRRARIPPHVRKRALARNRNRCIVCQRRVRLQLHHFLPVRTWPELTTVEANLGGICQRCHEAHECAHRRIPWTALPECAITLAYSTSGAAAVYFERTYPR